MLSFILRQMFTFGFMVKKNQYLRIIFGLKVKQRRQQLGLSFAELSKKSGIATSYLNEIEKGKKFPKNEKLICLAQALETTTESLLSENLPKSLKPIKFLLESNFLKEIPFDLFGLDLAKIIELLANAPDKVNAFISTLVELSRNFALGEHHFYLRAMRSYQELNNNYFPEIEQIADDLHRKCQTLYPNTGLPNTPWLEQVLKEEYGVQVIHDGIQSSMQNIRSIYQPNIKTLLLNGLLNSQQINLILAKEIGFQEMQLKERPFTSSFFEIESFQQVLNNFKAGYFSVAFLVDKIALRHDLSELIGAKVWKPEVLLDMLDRYQVAPETLFRRVNTVFQEDGLNDIFFMRFSKQASGAITLDKELHLSRKENPYALNGRETYCRRWSGIQALNIATQRNKMGIHAQISSFYEAEETYFVISILKETNKMRPFPISISFGVKLSASTYKAFKFLNDPAIVQKTVNLTCERCAIVDCAERVKEPTVLHDKMRRKTLINNLHNIINQK